MPPLFQNRTPFSGLCFESWGHAEDKWHTVVLRGTFRFGSNGTTLGAADQAGLVFAPEYWGEPGQSSLRFDTDLVPFKPATDVHITGHAHSPGGRLQTHWNVRVRVGSLVKQARVTGPRAWSRTMLGVWGLTSPEPVETVPLRYELCYGGTRTMRDGKQVAFEPNPVGRGYARDYDPESDKRVAAPQCEDPNNPITGMGNERPPAGFGPLPPVWLSRRAHAGTYDDQWLKNVWPGIPDDFNFAFYNSAAPDLVASPHLQGDEPIELDGLLASGSLRTRLPCLHPFVLVRQRDGELYSLHSLLDTVVVDTDAERLYLVWRARVPLVPAVRKIEARLMKQAGQTNG